MSERHTNRKSQKIAEPEMRSDYDFSSAERGKYYKRYLKSQKRGQPSGATASTRKRGAKLA